MSDLPESDFLQDMIAGALLWAEDGVPVFPVGTDKAPLTSNGHKDGSTDPDTIRAAFTEAGPRLGGIGAAMGRAAGLFAVDLDHYKGPQAEAWAGPLRAAGTLPPTRRHRTKSGGEHLIYEHRTEWPNVKPADAVEVKGEGGYIVVPPSPGYVVEQDAYATAPAALIAELQVSKVARRGTSVDALKAAILSGDDFHDALMQLSAKLAASGLPPEAVMEQTLGVLRASVASAPEHPRHARWQALMEDRKGELSRTVTGSVRFNPDTPSGLLAEAAAALGLPVGTWAAKHTPAAVDHQPAAGVTPFVVTEGQFPFVAGYFGYEDLSILDQTYVVYPILAEGEVMMISAPPKAAKTLIAQTLGMHIAAGADLGDLKIADPRPVIYFALESQVAIRRRMVAWKRSVDPTGTQLDEETFPFYVHERPIDLLNPEKREDFCQRVVAADKYFRDKGHAGLGAITLDTLTKTMPGGDQNTVEDTSAVFSVIGRLRELGISAPIIFIHHDNKAGTGTRGSSNIQAEPDTLLSVEPNDAVEGVVDLKVRMARNIEGTDSWAFRVVSVALGTSAQGYDIAAPIAQAIPKALLADISNPAGAALAAARSGRTLLERIVAEGEGVKNFSALHAKLSASMTIEEYPVGNKKALDKAVVEFYCKMIPPSGINLGNSNVQLQTVEQRDRRGKTRTYIRAVNIRGLGASVAPQGATETG